MKRTLIAATLVVATAWAPASSAQGSSERTTECARPPDADTVVRCALAASPEVRESRERLAAVAGRRQTASVWLPSNPTVSGNLASRRRPPPETASVLNWGVVLSQELEIAGQRGARVEAVDAEAAAQARRVGVAEQDVAAGALSAYHEAMAAQEGLQFATDLAQSAQALATFAEERAKEALLAGVEADVARAEATRIGLARLEAQRRLSGGLATLAALLDVKAADLRLPRSSAASLAPAPDASWEQQALKLRGEVVAAEMERKVLERRLDVIRRERIPNITLSAFAERGEINDRILGVGLSVPLPLPAPVGRTRAGDIAETLAQIQAAESSAELVRRRVRVEVAHAVAALAAREGASGLFAGDLLTRARADLKSLREAIASRQLPLREGLQWQRSLIELLQADIQARLDRSLALVDLRRVVGLPMIGTAGGAR
jgi:cobalt-zinc-cadmium efflux system outer membrane protein